MRNPFGNPFRNPWRKPKSEPESKRKRKPKLPTSLICLLRSGRFKNTTKLHELMASLLLSRNKEETLFLVLEDKGPLVDWITENGFNHRVYDVREDEEEAHRNFRLIDDAKAIVAFIPRSSTGDKHWDYIEAFIHMGKILYIVYDENGQMYEKKFKRPEPLSPTHKTD